MSFVSGGITSVTKNLRESMPITFSVYSLKPSTSAQIKSLLAIMHSLRRIFVEYPLSRNSIKFGAIVLPNDTRPKRSQYGLIYVCQQYKRGKISWLNSHHGQFVSSLKTGRILVYVKSRLNSDMRRKGSL